MYAVKSVSHYKSKIIVKVMFGSIIQEPFGLYLNFDAISEFTGLIILFKYCDEIPNKSPPIAIPKFANASSCDPLRGYSTSYPKLACFVLYLKIVNTFLKNNICIL